MPIAWVDHNVGIPILMYTSCCKTTAVFSSRQVAELGSDIWIHRTTIPSATLHSIMHLSYNHCLHLSFTGIIQIIIITINPSKENCNPRNYPMSSYLLLNVGQLTEDFVQHKTKTSCHCRQVLCVPLTWSCLTVVVAHKIRPLGLGELLNWVRWRSVENRFDTVFRDEEKIYRFISSEVEQVAQWTMLGY